MPKADLLNGDGMKRLFCTQLRVKGLHYATNMENPQSYNQQKQPRRVNTIAESEINQQYSEQYKWEQAAYYTYYKRINISIPPTSKGVLQM